MVVEAGVSDATPILELTIAGDGDEFYRGHARMFAQALHQFITVDVREADVDQSDIRPEALDRVDCIPGTVNHVHGMTFELEQQRESVCGIGIVVDDEYPSRCRLGRFGLRNRGSSSADMPTPESTTAITALPASTRVSSRI